MGTMVRKDFISVIIPVYKVEEYLKTCIDSVINQTYEKLEIIIVDDGSPDLCGKICDDYAQLDSRIIVIHKQNGGLSDARNAGMKVASGEYITFLDSDDWWKENFCEYALQHLKKYKADLYALSLLKISEDGCELSQNHLLTVDVMTPEQAIYSMFDPKKIPWCAQAKLYKRELFEGVEYPVGKLMEDKATTYKIFSKCTTIAFEDNPLYVYLVRDGSIMRSKFSERQMDSLEIQLELNSFIEANYPQAVQRTHAHSVRMSLSLLCQMISSRYNDKSIEDRLLKCMYENRRDFFIEKTVDYRYKVIFLFYVLAKFLLGRRMSNNKVVRWVSDKIYCKLSTK